MTPEASAQALVELSKALDDERADDVFTKLYPPARLTPEHREQFLRLALRHTSSTVRHPAVVELQRRGLLTRAVTDAVLELSRDSKPVNMEVAVLALADFDLDDVSDEFVVKLLIVIAQSGTDSERLRLRTAAENQLRRLGDKAVPAILDVVLNRTASDALRRTAAVELSKLMGFRFGSGPPRIPTGPEPMGGGAPWPPRIPSASNPAGGAAPPSAEKGNPFFPGPWETSGPGSPGKAAQLPVPLPIAPPAEAPAAPSAMEEPQSGSSPPDNPEPANPKPAVIGKATAAQTSTPVRERLDKDPQKLRVYYGTNREALLRPAPPAMLPWASVSAFTVFLLMVVQIVGLWYRWTPHNLLRFAVTNLVLVLLTAWIWNPSGAYSMTVEFSRGVVYGPDADPDGQMHYGHCDVTLPPVGLRKVGELPMAQPGFENPEKNVILESTTALAEERFFDELKQKLAGLNVGGRDVFVFVHGYNVDFRSAACRTAQLTLDLGFKGVPMFFSWPSESTFLGYTADVDEVQGSIGPIKRFLEKVALDMGAEKVHVLAHSKGGAAVSLAISQLDPNKKFFNQVILAAPDISATTFRTEVAPQLSRVALRATLYCSQDDRALQSSKWVNGVKRAGDGRAPLVVEPPLDTIDATGLDPSLLGHSYYGDSKPLIDDVRQLLMQNTSPTERGLRVVVEPNGKRHWAFGKLR